MSEVHVGYYEVTYTLQQLQFLRTCLACNGNTISKGVSVFVDAIDEASNPWPWIEFAEKIIADPEFPEKHFSDENRCVSPFTKI